VSVPAGCANAGPDPASIASTIVRSAIAIGWARTAAQYRRLNCVRCVRTFALFAAVYHTRRHAVSARICSRSRPTAAVRSSSPEPAGVTQRTRSVGRRSVSAAGPTGTSAARRRCHCPQRRRQHRERNPAVGHRSTLETGLHSPAARTPSRDAGLARESNMRFGRWRCSRLPPVVLWSSRQPTPIDSDRGPTLQRRSAEHAQVRKRQSTGGSSRGDAAGLDRPFQAFPSLGSALRVEPRRQPTGAHGDASGLSARLLAERFESRTHLLGELRLLPGCEVPTLLEPVVVDQFGTVKPLVACA
jgi:hypothetical protein